jgi:hypothetical protein
MAAGELTFKLYRRVWSVASLTDAIAVAWAVARWQSGFLKYDARNPVP